MLGVFVNTVFVNICVRKCVRRVRVFACSGAFVCSCVRGLVADFCCLDHNFVGGVHRIFFVHNIIGENEVDKNILSCHSCRG